MANSPFEFRREEYGIFLNQMLNKWVLPEIKKRIIKSHTLVAEFADDELDIIDETIANIEGNNIKFEKMMEEDITSEQSVSIDTSIRNGLKKAGKKREIEIPEGFLDIEGSITANITGELKNKAAILQSLVGIFKTVISTFNPNTGKYGALEDPVLSKIFGQIIEMSGVPLSAGFLTSAQGVDQSAVQPIAPTATPQAV